MEDKKQEIIEVENHGIKEYKNNTYSVEDMANVMSSTVSTIERMAAQIAQNNAEKYKAQSNVLIAEIEKERQNQSEEINRYYDTRMEQERGVRNTVEEYQNRINELWKKVLEAQNEEDRQWYKEVYESEQGALRDLLERQAKMINDEQNTRIENSRPRNKGLFGFLKRKL